MTVFQCYTLINAWLVRYFFWHELHLIDHCIRFIAIFRSFPPIIFHWSSLHRFILLDFVLKSNSNYSSRVFLFFCHFLHGILRFCSHFSLKSIINMLKVTRLMELNITETKMSYASLAFQCKPLQILLIFWAIIIMNFWN